MKSPISKLSLKELALLIADSLSGYGISAVLTGGSCVTIYSENKYVSKDLDFVTDTIHSKKIKAAMEDIGFALMPEKCFKHPGCEYTVEFIPSPLSVGAEAVKKTRSIKTKRGALVLLSPTDCVKDRLAAFYHWDDRQSLEQAVLVAARQKVDLKEIKRWSLNEGFPDKFEEFAKQLKGRR